MLSCIQNGSLSELKDIYLRYCSTMEIRSLRSVCKVLRKHIPLDWTISQLLVSDRSYSHYSMSSVSEVTRKCNSDDLGAVLKACSYVTGINLTQIGEPHITWTQRLEYLSSIMVARCFELQSFRVTCAPSLTNVFINRASKLTHLQLSEYSPIEDVSIFNTILDDFHICNWKTLKTLVWVNNKGSIRTLRIPKGCTQLEFLNLSGSEIVKVALEMDLEQCLCIQANNVEKLCLHTSHRNQSKIMVNMTELTSITGITGITERVPFVSDFTVVFTD